MGVVVGGGGGGGGWGRKKVRTELQPGLIS